MPPPGGGGVDLLMALKLMTVFVMRKCRYYFTFWFGIVWLKREGHVGYLIGDKSINSREIQHLFSFVTDRS